MAAFNSRKTLFALAALSAFAVAEDNGTGSGVGSAIVKNSCGYDVYVTNVPAAGGGHSQETYTLKSDGGNAPYVFPYTELSNGNGWSIKLSKSETNLDNIMQFETTWHDDGMIWYDVSDVNGNPWDGDWMITANNDICTPKKQAYRFSTDDAYGMQACKQDASITVTLCSGEEAASGEASSASASVASESSTSQAEATSYSMGFIAPSASSSTPSEPAVDAVSSPSPSSTSSTSSTPSTLSTSTTTNPAVFAAAPTGNVVATVTEVDTTTFVTTTYQSAPSQGSKRDVELNEHARVHEHIKRHRDTQHRHHAHF